MYCPVQYGTAAGPVTSEETLCVQSAEKAQSSSAFSSLPLGRKKYFISCGGKSWMVYQNFAAPYRFSDTYFSTLCVCTQRCRAKYSAELTAVLTGDSNTRLAEDQEQNNQTKMTPSFAILTQGEVTIMHFQFHNKKKQLIIYWIIQITKLKKNHSSDMAFFHIRSCFDVHNVWK